jgi:hypothetical protein
VAERNWKLAGNFTEILEKIKKLKGDFGGIEFH